LVSISSIQAPFSYNIYKEWWYSYLGFATALITSVIAAPVSVYIGCKREYISIQIGFIVFILLLPIYLIYKVVDIWTDELALRKPNGYIIDEKELKWILTTLALSAVIWRLCVMVIAIVVTCNFRKGLRKIFESEESFLMKYGFIKKNKRSLAETLLRRKQ
jgi:hypothetical protein